MYLRRVDLYGFKSFAREMTIELAPGITVLVGPNGGGKSNVVDAIRWVLGEQRLKELRADRWEDLLYAGGPGRRPAQMAEAFLEFDNTDGAMPNWPEVLRVGRRYYRQGESEYLVGSRPARLRDVADLFLDSGLGRAAYAIIGQGRVEATLTQRPQDRLEQLEEAAGTTRYKVRRRETRQHLQQVLGELTRAADLETQVAQEIETNREAAALERRYVELDRERQALSGLLRVQDLIRLRRELAAAETGEAEMARQAEAVMGELSGALEHQGDLELEAAAERQDGEQRRRVLDELGRRVQKLQADVVEAEVRREGGERLRRELEEQLGEAMAEDAPASADDTEEAGWEAREASVLAERAERRQLMESLQAALGDVRTTLETRQAEVRAMSRQLDESRRVQAQLSRLAPDSDRPLAEVLTALERERAGAEADLERLEADRRQRGEHFRELGVYQERQREELRLMEQHFAQRQARHRALNQLEAEGEGLQAGVRAVLRAQAEGHLQGIHGTLATLVESDDRYTVAIQAALGGAAQNLVAETEHHARAAVRHLQTRGLGRATFLALDIVRGGRPSADDRDLVHQDGVVGWAMDLVRVRPQIQAAAQHALGRVLVLETLDDAVLIGRLINFRYRLVTLDGQVVHPGGAITGGSPASAGTVWVRRQEMDRLAQELVVELGHLEGARERVAAVEQERAEVLGRIEASQAAEEPIRERVAMLRSRLEALRELAGESVVLDDSARVQLEAELSRRQGEAAVFAGQARELEARLGELREADAADRARLEELETVRTRRRDEMTRRAADADRLRARRAEMARRREAVELEMAAMAERARVAMEERDRQEVELRKLLDQDQELAGRRQERERALADLRERVRGLEGEVRRRERQREHFAAVRQRVAFQLEQLEQAKHADPRDHIHASTETRDRQEELDETEIAAARARLRSVEAGLGELGPVNAGSLALEERLAERRQFLAHHREDIERAVAELEETITEIDREVESRRQTTAAELEDAVGRTVQELFGGGSARFEWTGEPDPGLELWIEPPAKRPQSLQSLSGGEKALGALSWLFALLSLRPAPLVVLDEVEASLDELNARRFAQHIARHRQVQYLVVSHHKPTMEQADALWGFTADGQGVSRLVSVRLGEEGAS